MPVYVIKSQRRLIYALAVNRPSPRTHGPFPTIAVNFRPAPEAGVIIYSRVPPENHAVAGATRDTSSCDNLVVEQNRGLSGYTRENVIIIRVIAIIAAGRVRP